MKWILLLLVLLLLPMAYAQDCVDSDAVGLSLYNQGSVEYEGETYVDYCSGNELTEYSCEDGVMVMDKLNCDYGCVGGACVEGSSIDCRGLRKGEFSKDTMDYCYNENQMKDYYCTGGQATYQIVDCTFGCDEGHCLAEERVSARCDGFNYKNSCGTLVYDDCRHCGFDCGVDYECVEILDECGTGSTGACIKLDGTKILMKKSNQIISTETNHELSLVSNRIMVASVDLQTYPDKIYAKVNAAGYNVLNIELQDDMFYLIDAVKKVRILGVFSKEMKVKISVSSLPNAELLIDEPWWGSLTW
ncbi:MAG: hypothetical protein KAT77_03675 [Nanoarchaeota archaeon]|nr:hypothetical protein [Nanoarchaeota archaeon]